MDVISRSDLRHLIDVRNDACVSLYLPTHRADTETLQDPIRLKHLLRDAEQQLERRGIEARAVRDLLDPLRELVHQYEFWQHQADGLAIFRSPDLFRSYRVSFTVPELAIAAARFHLKPLIPALGTCRRFYILALSQDEAKVYEATRTSIAEVEMPGMLENQIASSGQRVLESQAHSHSAGRQPSGPHLAFFHGHGMREDDRKQALLTYFRRVDETVRKRLSDERTPIVLAAVDYLCPIYRQASSSPNLLSEEIHRNPAGFTPKELHRRAWAIVTSYFQEDRERAVDEYHQLWHTQRTSKDLPAIVTASLQGRIKVLFVAVGTQEWGHVDSSTSEVIQSEQRSPQDQDLLNSAAIETFIAGGTVCAVPPDQVPGKGSVAAIFRY